MRRTLLALALLAPCLAGQAASPAPTRPPAPAADELAAARDEGVALRATETIDAAAAVARTTQPAAAPAAASAPAPIAADPEVRRGRVVQLVLRSGGIRVIRVGIALSDGRPGQAVPVRIPGMPTLQGRVSGPGQVEIDV